MTLDIAMGGSTNTVLHLLAAAHEGEVDFTMEDIDRLSRRVPVLCKVAPSVADVHMEDVHRAGGIMAILGELDRAGLLDTATCRRVHAPTLGEALARWDVQRTDDDERARLLPRGAGRRADAGRLQPGRALARSSTSTATSGVIRDAAHAFSQGWRPGRALRQPRARRLHREDRRRRCQRS